MRFKRRRKITNAKIYEDKRDLYCMYEFIYLVQINNVYVTLYS